MDPELEALQRAYVDGLELALYELMVLCERRGEDVPSWAAEPLQELLSSYFKRHKARSGRSDDPVWRYRQDLIHYERYGAVNRVREGRGEWREYRSAALNPKRPAAERKRLQRYAWQNVNENWESVFFQASKYLKGSPAAGEPKTIKRSFELVQKILDLGQGGRFHVLTPETRKHFGIFWV